MALFEQTRRALHKRHRGRRLVTVADDVSLLDAPSLALVGYLAAQGTIFLIATVRTGEPVPDLVTGLWRDGGWSGSTWGTSAALISIRFCTWRWVAR